jgi:hypothetical protein
MAAESEQPTPRERPTHTGLDASPEREHTRPERYGPLALLRTRKPDGRALLLFNHAREERET